MQGWRIIGFEPMNMNMIFLGGDSMIMIMNMNILGGRGHEHEHEHEHVHPKNGMIMIRS